MNEIQNNLIQSIDPPRHILLRLVEKLNQGFVNEVLDKSQTLSIEYHQSVHIWNLIGSAAFKKCDLYLAESAFKNVVGLSTKDPIAFSNLGKVQQKLANAKDAVASFQESINLNPKVDDSWFNLGLSFASLGDHSSAIGAYQKTIELNPTHYGALVALAAKLREFNHFHEAINLLNKATQINENDVKCWLELGLNFQQIGENNNALMAHHRACKLNPESANAKNTLGCAYESSGDLHAAAEAYESAIKLDKKCVDAWINLGSVLQKTKKFEKSREAYEQAINLSPVYSHCRISEEKRKNGEIDRAINHLNKALVLEPHNAGIKDSLGIAHLLNEDFKKGFELYEWRWMASKHATEPSARRISGEYFQSKRPVWQGEPNQKILVWAEQGIGDEIMFASVMSDLCSISKKIILLCDRRLISIFERSLPAGVEFVEKDKKVAESSYDYHLPIGSLPRFFRPNKISFVKNAKPYLYCSKTKVEQTRRTLETPETKVLIGISWQTKSLLRGATRRNISLADLVAKFSDEKVRLVNLQYGDVSEQIRFVKHQTNSDVFEASEIDKNNDIDGLSHLISACDYIVTIDNFIAHLAGALGKETKVLLPKNNDWRWALQNETSYWYKSVRLYRQDEENNWLKHLEKINAELGL